MLYMLDIWPCSNLFLHVAPHRGLTFFENILLIKAFFGKTFQGEMSIGDQPEILIQIIVENISVLFSKVS